MSKIIIRLYDFFRIRRGLLITILLLSTMLLGVLLLRITFKENIADFLPFDNRGQESTRIYQGISGANRIIALVGSKSNNENKSEEIVEAVDDLQAKLVKGGIPEKFIISQVDIEKIGDVANFVYDNIPYFLTDQDYEEIEKKLKEKDYVSRQLKKDEETLLSSSGDFMADFIEKDPLNLFSPIVGKLSKHQSGANYKMRDGYIFTPDMKNAIVVIDSPYGSSETENNSALVEKISSITKNIENANRNLSIRLTGGPVIAVGNASQIKFYSILSVSIAVLLILLLLWSVFKSVRNILLIVVSIAWGWLLAMAGLSLVHSDISVIVIGISSVIIGIAVNYPLHLVAHLNHTPDIRRALKEIVAPLLVGNITTIGAFLTLVPLRSIALRDLGLFASLLLLGTILFVFLFLPHLVKSVKGGRHQIMEKFVSVKIENKRWIILSVAALTIIFAFFSFRTGFDTNLSHINYMTDEQKKDMSYVESLQKEHPESKTVYMVSSARSLSEALTARDKNVAAIGKLKDKNLVSDADNYNQFLFSDKEQKHRIEIWRNFVGKHRELLTDVLRAEASVAGYEEGAFDEFYSLLDKDFAVEQTDFFKPLWSSALENNFYFDKQEGTYNVIDPIAVTQDNLDDVSDWLSENLDDASHYHFEIGQLNSMVADSLSDNFNYIGYACAIIVFLFLWFSMGNIELAGLSFLPMAVSWIWILGLMGLTHTDFNIVNIILATFIFGQGDDYTIFMTEGCQYEYAYGRKMLASYKSSILISALIMFIGMGALIIAKHPALHSLAVITIIGMFSVVMMAWLLPPFVFNWIVSKNGKLRNRPLTLKSLLMPKKYPQNLPTGLSKDNYYSFVRDVYYYCGLEVVRKVKTSLKDCDRYIVENDNDNIVVSGDNYGAVALVMALANPDKTILARVSNQDDNDVCKNVACRIAGNITVENEDYAK